MNALQRFAERDITDRLRPLLSHGDGRQMAVGYGKLSKGFEVLDFRLGSFLDRCFRGHRAGLLSLLQPQVEGVAADVEELADMGLLLTSVNGRDGFLP